MKAHGQHHKQEASNAAGEGINVSTILFNFPPGKGNRQF